MPTLEVTSTVLFLPADVYGPSTVLPTSSTSLAACGRENPLLLELDFGKTTSSFNPKFCHAHLSKDQPFQIEYTSIGCQHFARALKRDLEHST
jgi:hypothetical protein